MEPVRVGDVPELRVAVEEPSAGQQDPLAGLPLKVREKHSHAGESQKSKITLLQ